MFFTLKIKLYIFGYILEFKRILWVLKIQSKKWNLASSELTKVCIGFHVIFLCFIVFNYADCLKISFQDHKRLSNTCIFFFFCVILIFNVFFFSSPLFVFFNLKYVSYMKYIRLCYAKHKLLIVYTCVHCICIRAFLRK